jgi:hypothetical protein
MHSLTDTHLRAALVERGRKQQERYSWDATAETIGRYLTTFTYR